jgi:hypothetical protein
MSRRTGRRLRTTAASRGEVSGLTMPADAPGTKLKGSGMGDPAWEIWPVDLAWEIWRRSTVVSHPVSTVR